MSKYADGTKWVDARGTKHYEVLNGKLWIVLPGIPQSCHEDNWKMAECREPGLTRIDPAPVPSSNDAAAKLVEAAREVVTFWLQTGLTDTARMTTLQAAVSNAFPPPAPAVARLVEAARNYTQASFGTVGPDTDELTAALSAFPPPAPSGQAGAEPSGNPG